MVLSLIAFSITNGASVAADSKEPNSETGSDSISNNGGPAEEKQDPHISGSLTFCALVLHVSYSNHYILN